MYEGRESEDLADVGERHLDEFLLKCKNTAECSDALLTRFLLLSLVEPLGELKHNVPDVRNQLFAVWVGLLADLCAHGDFLSDSGDRIFTRKLRGFEFGFSRDVVLREHLEVELHQQTL